MYNFKENLEANEGLPKTISTNFVCSYMQLEKLNLFYYLKLAYFQTMQLYTCRYRFY